MSAPGHVVWKIVNVIQVADEAVGQVLLLLSYCCNLSASLKAFWVTASTCTFFLWSCLYHPAQQQYSSRGQAVTVFSFLPWPSWPCQTFGAQIGIFRLLTDCLTDQLPKIQMHLKYLKWSKEEQQIVTFRNIWNFCLINNWNDYFLSPLPSLRFLSGIPSFKTGTTRSRRRSLCTLSPTSPACDQQWLLSHISNDLGSHTVTTESMETHRSLHTSRVEIQCRCYT